MASELKVGQWVMVLDENMEGEILSMNPTQVTLMTADGFSITYPKKSVVAKVEKIDLGRIPFSVVQQKEERKRKKINPFKKAKQVPPMEVDLHIQKLVKRFNHMSNFEILDLQLDTAKRKLEFALEKRIQRVVFIHGVGEGVLRAELHTLFRRYPVTIQEADYRQYGQGATEVYIPQNL